MCARVARLVFADKQPGTRRDWENTGILGSLVLDEAGKSCSVFAGFLMRREINTVRVVCRAGDDNKNLL